MNALDLRFGMIEAVEQLVDRVAFCAAVERNHSFQAHLRQLAACADDIALLVRPPHSQAWLKLPKPGMPLGVLREPPGGIHRLDLTNVVQSDPDFLHAISAVMLRSEARDRAVELTAPMFDARASLNASQLAKLLDWAPMIEHFAYTYFTHASMLLDELRRPFLKGIHASSPDRDHALLEYWTVLHSMGHMLTIASSAGARDWLSDMASSFKWVQWTPSFALVRERTLWLTVAAVRSAMAFGESVVDSYLTKLSSADHPIKTFDCLAALAALGLHQPRLATSLIAELEKLKASTLRTLISEPDHVASLFDGALGALRQGEHYGRAFREFGRLEGRWQLNRRSQEFAVDVLRTDPTDRLRSGETIGFATLPYIVRSDPTAYYPASNQSLLLAPRDIRRILKRAWALERRYEPTLH